MMSKHSFLFLFSCFILLCGCHPTPCDIETQVEIIPQQSAIDCLPSAFNKLTPKESSSDWGKELVVGYSFAKEFDLYRAITAYKRALVFIPLEKIERRQQIYYSIFQCYYLGQKYEEAIDIFENTELKVVTSYFPALRDLLIMLQDAYVKTGEFEKAENILQVIQKNDESIAEDIRLSIALKYADLPSLSQRMESECFKEGLNNLLDDYHHEAKSVRKAETLNALLPGAGYYYVGQKKTALTSFLLNTLFIATTYKLFDNGYIAAGLFTLSLEFGWYAGGIHGAGLAAKQYNEYLYRTQTKDYMLKNRLFPLLMIETAF